MRTPSKAANRPGLSLAEVLVAMFVIAIGLLALLTFFPLGASQMAQAIKDDRTGHAANNGADVLRSLWKDYNRGVNDTPRPSASPTNNYKLELQFAAAQDFPGATFGSASPSVPSPSGSLPVVTTGRSYPVFVDPIGFLSSKNFGNSKQWWFCGDANLGLPRRSLPGMATLADRAAAIRATTLLDDITFTAGGLPDASTGVQVPRDGRYSWSWMIQRTSGMSWQQTTLTVITYAGRSIDNPFDETPFSASVSGTQATLSYPGAKPKLRKGGWVFLVGGGRAVDWCRVTSIDDSTPGQLRLELQSPPRNVGGPVTCIINECVSEVFTKDELFPTRPPSPN